MSEYSSEMHPVQEREENFAKTMTKKEITMLGTQSLGNCGTKNNIFIKSKEFSYS